jgi:translation initiation factor IF-1
VVVVVVVVVVLVKEVNREARVSGKKRKRQLLSGGKVRLC